MKKEIKDVAASVHQRLLNRAQETRRPFDELLHYFAMERFLYRLSLSKYKDKVVLKGALMFIVWETPRSRATRDIDFLGRMPNAVENLETMVREVCETKAEPDGIMFDPASVKGEKIKKDADYAGVRIRLIGKLGQARANMQIDCGFGDVVTPDPTEIDYPTILDMPKPRLKGYPRETVVAEKFEAMANRGILNSRMKDYYDLWVLAQQFDFNGDLLRDAVLKTFTHRRTELSTDPVALSSKFFGNTEKQTQWKAFIHRTQIENAPQELEEVILFLRGFLIPLAKFANNDKSPGMWAAPGPWKN